MGITTKIPLTDPLAKNYVVNGGMRIFQRENSFSPVTQNDLYLIDRYRLSSDTATFNTKFSMSPSTQIPNVAGIERSLAVECTDTHTPTGSAELFGILAQTFEREVIDPLIGKKCIYSFYVQSNHNATYSVVLGNWAINSYRKHVLFDVIGDGQWRRVSIPITLPASISYQEGNLPAFFAAIELSFDAEDALPEGEYVGGIQVGRSTVGQDSLFDTIGNEIKVTGFMLHEGEEEIPFSNFKEDKNDELEFCKRYFERQEYSGTGQVFATGYVQSSGVIQGTLAYREKISTPVITTTFGNGNGMVFRSKNVDLPIPSAPSGFAARGPAKSVFTVSISNSIGNGSAGFFRANTGTLGYFDIDSEF